MSRAVPNKQKLTSLTVTKLKSTTKPFLVWDTHQRGLALQISVLRRSGPKQPYGGIRTQRATVKEPRAATNGLPASVKKS